MVLGFGGWGLKRGRIAFISIFSVWLIDLPRCVFHMNL